MSMSLSETFRYCSNVLLVYVHTFWCSLGCSLLHASSHHMHNTRGMWTAGFRHHGNMVCDKTHSMFSVFCPRCGCSFTDLMYNNRHDLFNIMDMIVVSGYYPRFVQYYVDIGRQKSKSVTYQSSKLTVLQWPYNFQLGTLYEYIVSHRFCHGRRCLLYAWSVHFHTAPSPLVNSATKAYSRCFCSLHSLNSCAVHL